jgi:hypothetical protein
MRIPNAQIKAAFLHPESEIRLTAIRHFTESYSQDPTVMPIVIEVVERYRNQDTFALLRAADRLSQTPATIDWLMSELGRKFNLKQIAADNYRFAVAIVLCNADPELLASRHREITALPAFPEQLAGPLKERMEMYFADWSSLWTTLEGFGREKLHEEELTLVDTQRLHRILEALARHRKEGTDTVLTLLRRNFKGHDKKVMHWLEPQIVALAGRMQVKESIPLILERLNDDDEDDPVRNEISTALTRIGGDAVVRAVNNCWKQATTDSRYVLAETLEHIHTDKALGRLLRSLAERDDFDLEIFIAHSALAQLDTDAIEPVRQLLLETPEDELDGETWDLRYNLVATATLMGVKFPEYKSWHKEALATNYGWTKVLPMKLRRLSDNYSNPRTLSAALRDITGSGEVFQLKITLKGIRPSIWRRVLVPDCTLDELHKIIQAAMGWENCHLYAFKFGPVEFTHPDADNGELSMEDATAIGLSELIGQARQKFIYTYDFGDCWDHEVLVEKTSRAEPGQELPLCVQGSRACPPEDVGGAPGYAEYLEALADPSSERYEELLGWRGEFDPEAFDVDAVNRKLGRT